ncbi:hypothetical protein BASA81_000461 [Batrachochytrium salamandrivorans]|nr:hypothetical protein BASA81_000461 [Batrachochytrium salamandrivorans]
MGGSRKKTMTDFKIIKKKVGVKAKPANQTSTKFESKQLVLRTQTVVSNLDSDQSQVSSRGLTVDQLMYQTRHYNPKIRKEAFAQLVELAARVNTCLAIKKSFALCLESLADSGMRDLDQDSRRAFHELLTTLLTHQFVPTPIQITTIINLMFVCLTEGEGIDRRLDSTKTLALLLEHTCTAISPLTIARLVPCYADLCRTVLGTNSSSLAKREAGVILRKGTVGKIMAQMKEAEKLEQMNKKLKRSKTTENSIVALENAFDTERLVVASNAALLLCKLLPNATMNFQSIVLPLLLAVLEVFRHAIELRKPEAYLPCAEALWRVLELYADKHLSSELCGDIQRAFSHLHGTGRFEVKRLECLLCIAAHGVATPSWLESCLDWFIQTKDAQKDETVNERLWFTPHLLSNVQRERVLECFTVGLSLTLLSRDDDNGLMWRLMLVQRLLGKVDSSTRMQWCKDLPRALWTLGGGSVLDLEQLQRCTSTVERLMALGFDILRQCALLEDSQVDAKEWVDIARSMSSFYASQSTKTQQVAWGPFFRFPSWLRTDLVSFLIVLPVSQLPGQLLKNWCQTLLPSGAVTGKSISEVSHTDASLLIEMAFKFALKQDSPELILSFALTMALKTKHTALVCILVKSLWRNTRWPIAEMISPTLIESQSATLAWLEFASTVLSCSELGEEEQDLKRVIEQTIAKDWRLVATPQLLTHLQNRTTPEEICQDCDVAVAGWIDFLLQANQQGYSVGSWSWGEYPKLQALTQSLSLKHSKLASDLKLLLADLE